MSAKDDILNELREHQPPDAPLPDLQGNWIEYQSAQEHFCSVVEAVGGEIVHVSSQQQLEEEVHRVIQNLQARAKSFQNSPEVAAANVDLETLNDPHECENLDFVLINGQLGVAGKCCHLGG